MSTLQPPPSRGPAPAPAPAHQLEPNPEAPPPAVSAPAAFHPGAPMTPMEQRHNTVLQMLVKLLPVGDQQYAKELLSRK